MLEGPAKSIFFLMQPARTVFEKYGSKLDLIFWPLMYDVISMTTTKTKLGLCYFLFAVLDIFWPQNGYKPQIETGQKWF